jgi:acetolactate synthase-1/2/3 large subunit
LQPAEPDAEDLSTLVRLLQAAERPMVIVGGGVVRARAEAEFMQFVRKADVPVAYTLMGVGAIPSADPLAIGMIGMHGTQASNTACDECDLLIGIGCRFSDRVALTFKTFCKQAKIVHIDIDRAEVGKNVRTDHHIIGDAKRVLARLNQITPAMEHGAWKKQVFSRPRETVYDADAATMNPRQVLERVMRAMPADAIVATDVGQHQMWAIQHLKFNCPGQLLTSGGYGTMGFGLGAALGAKAAFPNKTVLHIAGDGCFRMNSNELSTEAFYHLDVITIIFNNQTLGMVRQWQSLIYDKRYSQTDLNRGPDFVKLAAAYGLPAARVTTVQELDAALAAARDCGSGFVIDVQIDTDELVRPMVGAGSHITDFLIG